MLTQFVDFYWIIKDGRYNPFVQPVFAHRGDWV